MQVIFSFYFKCAVVTCSSLNGVNGGEISYSSSTPYDYGTRSTYSCSEGYVLVGGDASRTCITSGSKLMGYWNGTAPSCSGK